MKRLLAAALCTLLQACDGSSPADNRLQATAMGCDASLQSCHVELGGTVAELRLGPDVRPLRPFAILARLDDGDRVDEVIADFQMDGMDMGPNRYRLHKRDGVWQGKATLPVCTTSRMDWIAVLEFRLDGQAYRLQFPFTTQ